MDSLTAGFSDIVQGAKRLNLSWLLAVDQLRRSHRRTVLGILWLLLPLAVTVAVFIWIFSQVFQQSIDGFEIYLGSGIIVWTLIATLVTGSAGVVMQNARWITTQPLPISALANELVIRAVLQFGLALLIYVVLVVVYDPPRGPQILLMFPGVALILMCGWGLALVLGPLGARFRDIAPALGVGMQVAFVATPIIWPAEIIRRRVFFIDGNPFYHLVQVVRAPMIGELPTAANWTFAIGTAVVCLTVGLLSFGALKRRVYYWIS